MSDLASIIQKLAQADTSQLIAERRQLHRQPEASFREFTTSGLIEANLRAIGLDPSTGWAAGPDPEHLPGKTGLRAVLALGLTAPAGPTIALRADFDGLPIEEATGLDFASLNPGFMHACGHDAHAAMLLSAARILQQFSRDYPQQVQGQVVLIFQPAEELAPGGAAAMIREGVLQNPAVAAIFGQHINPSLPAGQLGFRPGLFMAGVEDFEITISGQGGHAAGPHKLIDPVPVAAQLILALQTVVSRRADPLSPTVLSIGRLEALGAYNIIPDRVIMRGTFRALDRQWQDQAMTLAAQLSQELCASFGATATFRRISGYPPLINHTELCAQTRAAAVDYVGADQVVDLPPVMWAEDFAYYGQATAANFYNLGVGNIERGWTKPLHNSQMMIDETALSLGAGFLAFVALRQLLTNRA